MVPNKGRMKSPEENNMLIYAIIASLKRTLKTMDTSSLLVNWNSIDKEVAHDFHVRGSYDCDLHEAFHEDGEILMVTDNQRSFSSCSFSSSTNSKINGELLRIYTSFLIDNLIVLRITVSLITNYIYYTL